jgi:group I intron endonuclease
MKSGIYKITNIANGKCYIGSAVNFKNRWNVHVSKLNLNKHHSVILQSAWNKHGKESFKFEVLLICSKEELLIKEQEQLDFLKPEYNVCKIAGSRIGTKSSNETKEKLRKVLLGNKYCLGLKASEETKVKMSKSRKGKNLSESHKIKIGLRSIGKTPMLGKSHSEETKVKMSNSALGNKRWLGVNHSEESKNKMSKARKSYWETKNILKVWNCAL